MNPLPFSTSAEQAIIGAVLHDNSALEVVTHSLGARMFYVTEHAKIFKIILHLYSKGLGVDIVTLSNYDEVSEAYLYECFNTSLGISNLKTHIATVLELYTKRVLIQQAKLMEQSVGDQVKTGLDIAKEVSANLNNIISFKSKSKLITPENVLDTLHNLRAERKVRQFLTTGFPLLNDKLVAGFPLRNISVIAGCGSNLKSAFRSTLEMQMCDKGVGVMSIALEQDDETELERKMACMSRVPYEKIIRDKMNEEERARLTASGEYFAEKYNYHLLADKGASIASIRHTIDATMNKWDGIRICFVDLFSYVEEVMSAENTPQLITMGLHQFDIMAQEYNIHFCLLVHILRDSQKKDKKKQTVGRPYIHQIKGSGAYQERARLIFLTHRPQYYDKEIREDTLELNIAKQANGAAGERVNLVYDFEPTTFRLTEKSDAECFYYGEEEPEEEE